MSFDLTHVRHDPAHCLAPGLFRSLKRGERKRLKLDVTYTHGEDSIRFWGPEPLGVDDLRILQGLVAMAAISGDGGRGIVLRNETESEVGQQLRLLLDLKWDAVEKDAMVAKGSFRQLARELGYADDGGSQFKTIRDSIERLWAVSVIVERNGQRQGFRILSDYVSDDREGKLFVSLNPRLAEAVMGERPHTRLDMTEVRALQTDPARLIHQRLSGWIDAGKSGRVELKTLCNYVWPEETKNPNTLKKRRQTARKALAELISVGWTVHEYAKGKWEIRRPGANQANPRRDSTHPRHNGTRFNRANACRARLSGLFWKSIQDIPKNIHHTRHGPRLNGAFMPCQLNRPPADVLTPRGWPILLPRQGISPFLGVQSVRRTTKAAL